MTERCQHGLKLRRCWPDDNKRNNVRFSNLQFHFSWKGKVIRSEGICIRTLLLFFFTLQTRHSTLFKAHRPKEALQSCLSPDSMFSRIPFVKCLIPKEKHIAGESRSRVPNIHIYSCHSLLLRPNKVGTMHFSTRCILCFSASVYTSFSQLRPITWSKSRKKSPLKAVGGIAPERNVDIRAPQKMYPVDFEVRLLDGGRHLLVKHLPNQWMNWYSHSYMFNPLWCRPGRHSRSRRRVWFILTEGASGTTHLFKYVLKMQCGSWIYGNEDDIPGKIDHVSPC